MIFLLIVFEFSVFIPKKYFICESGKNNCHKCMILNWSFRPLYKATNCISYNTNQTRGAPKKAILILKFHDMITKNEIPPILSWRLLNGLSHFSFIPQVPSLPKIVLFCGIQNTVSSVECGLNQHSISKLPTH